ncbi:hypothetical protein A6V39_00685 [Candidatus Mycoplasma haematobovis]|uniref:Uncharacterized protein n=1 Tax=Candidatus Mycoplasma haematobovis TaxID=432608 RepID=A0A1A9QDL3_9MOLU|nr:hypothetical protein [Candidatus Mycoplasma haematobovis]OAL10567.1 hypothetical protein A6V39_00685 [Candidatus Mycoplasma haematobovis]
MTAAGTSTAVIFNLDRAKNTVDSAFGTVKQVFLNSYLYDGIKKTGDTLKDWFTVIINSKDDFREWVKNYLGADGLKSGAVDLYRKLYDWGGIVYRWFRDKFLVFISNIPQMVKDWKKIRLSLFKWGTFLGGGGGSALWAMFSSGANFDKLGELMGRDDFEDMMNDFNKLVQDNEDSFKEMGSEGIQDIIQKYLDNPEEAKQAAKELIKEQEEKNKENEQKKEEEKEPKKELSSEEIQDKFNPKKGGKPETPGAVFNSMVSKGIEKMLASKHASSFDSPIKSIESEIENGMREYISAIEEDLKKTAAKNSKVSKAKQDFLDTIKDAKELFIKSLAKSVTQAYQISDSRKPEDLKKKLAEVLTIPCLDGDDCNADGLTEVLTK